MKFDSSIVTNDALIVTIDNKVYNVSSDHVNFQKLKNAFKENDVESFINHYDVQESLSSFLDGDEEVSSGIEIVGEIVYYNSQPIHNSVTDAIVRMMREGFSIKPMVSFLENLMQNPSSRSVNELYDFLEVCKLTITEDGCFLAYKTVRDDYKDKYSGRIDNTPGNKAVPRMDRNQVDDDCTRHCSHGYHVGALEYAGPGGWYNSPNDKVIICKINPKDVVSVPRDHDFQKLRCCYYEPVGEYNGPMVKSVYSGEVGDDYSEEPEEIYGDEFVEPEDMLEGIAYAATYRFKQRYFIVDHKKSGYVVAELIDPEECAGEFRTFRLDLLEDVEEFGV